jgi:hypothetical protein
MNLNEHREMLRRNDLEMSKRLNKIIEDSKPKPVPDMKLNILKPPIMQEEPTGTPEYRATKQLANLLLTQQLDNTITSAMNAITGKTPEKDTKVSQEAQDEYTSMTPIEVGGKQQLYYDVPIPALPRFVPKPYTSHFTNPKDFKLEKDRLLRDLNISFRRRESYQKEINKIEDLLNAKAYVSSEGFKSKLPPFNIDIRREELKKLTVSELYDERDKYPKLKSKAKTVDGLAKAISEFEDKEYKKILKEEESTFLGAKVAKTEANLQGDLQHYKDLLTDEEAKILQIETDIPALDADYQNFIRINEENAIEQNKINNERRLLATDALNTFNRLNQGRVQIQREPHETDDELLARIDKLGQIPVDAVDVENQILLKAKKNILELTSDLTVGELVLKKLSPDEQHVMNKIFPKIKKNFNDSFGLNNKSLSDSDITQFIRNEINDNPLQRKIVPVKTELGEEALAPAEEGLKAIGSGLPHRVLPSKFVFGKIKIDLNKLFYRNILSITDNKGKQMNGYPNKRVSDNFVDVIFKILENKTITKTDLKNIHSERMIYDNLIVLSGIHKSKSIPTTIEDTAPEMKNRLGLIVGEIEAGNSNKELLKELHELLFKMSQINLISRSAATKYYNNIKSEFYPEIK